MVKGFSLRRMTPKWHGNEIGKGFLNNYFPPDKLGKPICKYCTCTCTSVSRGDDYENGARTGRGQSPLPC